MDVPLLDTDLKFFSVAEREYVLDVPTSTLFEIHPTIKKILLQSVGHKSTEYLEEIKRDYNFMEWMDISEELRYMIDNRHITIYASEIAPYQLKEQKINSLILNICHDCNMRCSYCYQQGGSYDCEPEYMREDVVLKSLEYLFKESPDDLLYLTISGGEPLLNPELVRYILQTAKENEEKYEKKILIRLITNGTLLDKDILQELKDGEVELIVTLGGIAEEHNQIRVFNNSRPSYDVIRDRLQLAKKHGLSVRIKDVIHHENVSLLQEIFDGYSETGYEKVILEPIIAAEDVGYSLTDEDLQIVKKQYDRLFAEMAKKSELGQSLHRLNRIVQEIHWKKNQGYACGVGKSHLCIVPNGDIYPCHLFVGQAEFVLGNILDATFNQERRQQFYQPLHVLNREGCQRCWVRYFCGGGCVGENYLVHGDLSKRYQARCQITRYIIEKAIYYYLSQLTDDDKLQKAPERRKSGREIYKIG